MKKIPSLNLLHNNNNYNGSNNNDKHHTNTPSNSTETEVTFQLNNELYFPGQKLLLSFSINTPNNTSDKVKFDLFVIVIWGYIRIEHTWILKLNNNNTFTTHNNNGYYNNIDQYDVLLNNNTTTTTNTTHGNVNYILQELFKMH